MNHPNFITTTIEKKPSAPKKEKFILFKPGNMRPDNSSPTEKTNDNLFPQSIETNKPELNTNKNSSLSINDNKEHDDNYPILNINKNNISSSKFYLNIMKYIIIIENGEEQGLNNEASMNIEGENQLIKDNPFYKEAERKIIEFIKNEKKMLQESLLQEFKMRMKRIDEDCQMKQDRLLNGVIQEIKEKNLLIELKK